MRVGVTFPQTEIGTDVEAIRAYAQAAEELGYAHILAYDHVLGADPAARPGWRGYTHRHMFHEPFVLLGFMAAITRRIEFVTGVIILPQRQTALVAKQAAQLDVLSGGRLRLGVGVGWNAVEYQALGVDFQQRGRVIEEQVAVLRQLWTAPLVTFRGRWHTIDAAGLNPLPVQQPIPLWMGGGADVLLRRVARMGDGWFPQMPPDDNARQAITRLRSYVAEAGRKPDEVGIEARISIGGKTPDEWARELIGWRDLGATHVAVNTMGAQLATPAAHIDALQRFKAVADATLGDT
jgi:probable F420-dependent oxidoreductase